ncbi:phosphatidate cytidylyltransferase [Catonella morbi ATCC 51271]|uniref:Phosphatidate cytidylyltransferase n=1 Tax=Catonella morbi ATCC 51271 TaxID=592026 RepID=V2Y329_9FIRM|nr:DUF92 domain-containing protein [Catonella morbi]ESL02472.1 phosphatidate cytidylyltransferase [Catonella morbi ATCC 51271]
MNILLIGISFVYIFAIIGFSTIFFKKNQGELSRKFIHIMVGNWVFISVFFTEVKAAIFVPAVFIIINALSRKYNLISSMERQDDSLGTVYYSISLCVTVAIRFATGWNMFPIIGILIMAYGDGLAALIGAKFGKRKPYYFAPNKTLAGSVTVFAVATAVTAITLLTVGETEHILRVGIGMIVLISLCNGFLSAFIEAAGIKGSDNLTLPIGSALFATLSFYYGDIYFFIYLAFSICVLLMSLKLRLLTADGVVAAILTAITLYLLGGVWIALSLYAFYFLGSSVSKIKNERKLEADRFQESNGARTWRQVVCNSLPACILVFCKYYSPSNTVFSLLSFAVFAAATADTFSSEIGVLGKGRVFSIITGKNVQRGVSGGISWLGLLAGLTGGFLSAWLAFPQFGYKGIAFVTLMAFAGTLFDSVLGALFQRKYLTNEGLFSDKKVYEEQNPVQGLSWMSNNAVNLISLFIVVIVGHFVNLIWKIF